MFRNFQAAEADPTYRKLKDTIIKGEPFDFWDFSLALFALQRQHNPVYQAWCAALGKSAPWLPQSAAELPFLPIQFFKSDKISIFEPEAPLHFLSSGTGQSGNSRHPVYQAALYDQLSLRTFERFYGPVEKFFVAALLPAYLERSGSSLVRMADHFIRHSADADSGFFLYEQAELSALLKRKKAAGARILLLGVSFALLDLAEAYPQDLAGAIVMETGGMKGRRSEIVRAELHQKLQTAFNLEQIHSEYGMTELFSQAYSSEAGLYQCPAQMKVLVRETSDPLSLARPGKTGGLNIIDLANLDSCAFIESQDLGRSQPDGRFEVLGRFDQAEVRGCNLMWQ